MSCRAQRALPIVSFDVPGVPVTQGSKTTRQYDDGRVVMFETHAHALAAWRTAVGRAALVHVARRARFEWPISCTLMFRFPMPKRALARDRRRGSQWGGRGDVDKLTRAVLDALQQSTLISNDGHVCELHVTKFVTTIEQPGVSIDLEQLDPNDLLGMMSCHDAR